MLEEVAILRETGPETQTRNITVHRNLAYCQVELGEPEHAVRNLCESIRLARVTNTSAAAVARLQVRLGLVLEQSGELDEARQELEPAFDILSEDTKRSGDAARCLLGLARVALAQDDPHGAEALASEALALADGSEHESVAGLRFVLGESLLAQGNRDEGGELMRAALDALLEHGVDKVDVRRALAVRGRTCSESRSGWWTTS